MANIVKAKELGEYLKLSESTIYKLAQSNQLPGVKIGDSWRFDMDEVNELIKEKKNLNKMQRKNRVNDGQSTEG
jgi:excisionase family DNA binding protein